MAFFERKLATEFPFPKCDLAFVPRFGSLAFCAPGRVTIREGALDDTLTRDGDRLTVICHELAHDWIGGWSVDNRRRQVGWLIDALATYLGRTATEHLNPGTEPWRASSRPNPPGHGDAAEAQLIKNLEQVIGRTALFDGLRTFLQRFAGAFTVPHDLTACWSRASGRQLPDWTSPTRPPSERPWQ